MNIWGVLPNIGEISGAKSPNKATGNNMANYKGPSFAESMKDIARSANMQISNGSTAGSLQFNRKKEELVDEPFSFTEAEKEMAEEYVDRINKLLKELKK